jgi:integrase
VAGKSNKGPMRGLRLKGQTWWFKVNIPADCRAALGGKTAVPHNLGTSDVRIAQARRAEVEPETRAMFADIRAGRYTPANGTSPAARGQLWRETIAALEVDPETDPRLLHGAETAQEAEWDRLGADDRQSFADARFGRVSVDHHLSDYLTAISALAPATVRGRKGHILRLAKWCETANLRLDAIDQKAAGCYVTKHIQPMHPVTAGEHMSTLRAYWTYLHSKGHVSGGGGDAEGGPWVNQLTLTKGRRANRGDKDKERPFSTEEVRTLLYSPYPRRMEPRHQSQIADALRISLLSGMRLEEVLTLWVEEVHDAVFDIQQGKTEAAARTVPIHPDLAAVVERRTKGKGPKDWLFHELRAERDPGDTFGKRFHRYRVKLGVNEKRAGKRRSLVTFHSARHWFMAGASHAGQPVETIGSVVGHRPDKKKNITYAVYIKTASDAQRRACVESVWLPAPISQGELAPAS